MHKRLILISILLLVTVSNLTLATAQQKGSAKNNVRLKRVPEILEVHFELQTTEPPNLIVTAVGNVSSGGWTDVQLLRREYTEPPADGIWEYDLLAKPPEGPALQVISKVKAVDVWEKVDAEKLKGIRVYGLGNGIKTMRVGE